jgi:Cu-Zn family superoxide dismutase
MLSQAMRCWVALWLAALPAATQQKTVPPPTAKIVVKNAKGQVLGTLALKQERSGVHVSGRLTGLPPGKHAIHFHDGGMCEPPDFRTAGSHFNPTGKRHSSHAGDLGNLVVNANGSVTVDLIAKDVTLFARPNSVAGSPGAAFVVHAGEDDLRTEPDGKSGLRIACGTLSDVVCIGCGW